ncbi:metallophosphoesterase [Campylobacter sp. MOP7]|uniref:metallophosphoesterase family protein n=1 Tax=Campylobacter canis TaxID=3378588 RepID=UPI00387E8BCA
MKIFHASDLHFNVEYFKHISALEDKFDIFCFSGDLLDGYSPLATQIEKTSDWLSSFKKPIFVCSGNHDIGLKDEWLKQIKNIYSDDTIKNINGIKFGCSKYLEEDILKFADCDILITHLPPAKTKTSISKNNKDYGDMELYRLVKHGLMNVKIILCGHIHDPIARIDTLNKSTIYNSSSDGALEPFYQVINI